MEEERQGQLWEVIERQNSWEKKYTQVLYLWKPPELHLFLASLNGFNVCTVDVSPDFLYVKSREKVYVITGDEFGRNKGKTMLIYKGLYGIASAAAWFQEISLSI